MNEELASLLAALIKAVQAQTDAINQLAASNMALVDLIADGMVDEEEVAEEYLDGSKRS